MNKLFTLLIITVLSSSILFSAAITGKVTNIDNNKPVAGILIKVKNSSKYAVSKSDGSFSISNLPKGDFILVISSMNWEEQERKVTLSDEETKQTNFEITQKSFMLNDLIVYGVTKSYEKITESPASVEVQFPEDLAKTSRGNQLARTLTGATGVDILQNGTSDFIVNTRGFNNGLNRRLLVLQDGRDASMPLLGAQEWNSFALPLDEFKSVELVRGPSAALYGANAFNGVLNLTSFAPRDVIGTKISILGGDYETYRADIRHAGLLGDLSYKVTLGSMGSLNYSRRRDSVQFLEYDGLALERKTLTDENRQTFSHYGTFRMDYDFDYDKKLTGEFGYSRSGNESYVFGLGRTLVTDVARPYVRLGYNTENIHIHAHWMNRSVQDTMWLMVPGAPLLDDSEDFLVDVQHNFYFGDDLHLVWGISQQFQMIRTSGTSIPNDVDADYTGVYGQMEWQISDIFKAVISARFDRASIHNSQFSPRLAIVANPIQDHSLRLSFGRSFQRPNYSELYRLTPDAPAFATSGPLRPALLGINKIISDSISALTGQPAPDIDLNLLGTRAYAIGNDELKVEQNIGLEFGYKGIISKKLYVTADFYYNKITDFITNFLPGVNDKFQEWQPNLEGDLAQYNELAYNIVRDNLSPRDMQRLSYVDGAPAFVVSNANVGEVDQYGFDLGINFYLTDELLFGANYSYYDFKVVEANITQPLLPNTSPNRINFSLGYEKPEIWDAKVSFHYSEGYDWLAGTFVGEVPSYNFVNLNAGAFIMKGLRFGVNVFNLFNNNFYQVFGGTYLPRYTTARISYEF